jgi:hypothetical protein
MIEGVEQPIMRPRVGGRVQTILSGRVGMDFANEREGPVKMGVPGNRADCEYAGGGQCGAGDERGLMERVRRPAKGGKEGRTDLNDGLTSVGREESDLGRWKGEDWIATRGLFGHGRLSRGEKVHASRTRRTSGRPLKPTASRTLSFLEEEEEMAGCRPKSPRLS